jgi:hypothetical protein
VATAAAESTLVPGPAAVTDFGAWTRGRIAELSQHLLAEVEHAAFAGTAPDGALLAAQPLLVDGTTQARSGTGEVAAASLFAFLQIGASHPKP